MDLRIPFAFCFNRELGKQAEPSDMGWHVRKFTMAIEGRKKKKSILVFLLDGRRLVVSSSWALAPTDFGLSTSNVTLYIPENEDIRSINQACASL